MIKENVRIKENITIVDQITAIESIVSSAFTYNEETEQEEYTPYYIDMAKIISIASNFIEGITFDDGELIYDLVMNDEELFSLVKEFYYNMDETDEAKKENEKNQSYIGIMNMVMNHVADMIEFKKQQCIHKNETFD